jgi:AraC family transcriptional regulator
MQLDLSHWRDRAPAGQSSSAGATSFLARGLTGGGEFRFEGVSIGIMLSPLASHRARYASDRQVAVPLAAGEGWVFPAGAVGHCDWSGGNDFLSLELAPGAFAAEGLTLDGIGRLGGGALDPLTVTLALQIHAAADPAQRLYRDTLTGALATHLAQSGALTGSSGGAFAAGVTAPSVLDDARLKRARDLIEANLAQPLSLDRLAAEAGMSPFHFARAFKAALGAAPHAYVVARRIAAAKALLDTTALPVSEIALRVGWEHAGKFSARFKAETGMTPGQWRAR